MKSYIASLVFVAASASALAINNDDESTTAPSPTTMPTGVAAPSYANAPAAPQYTNAPAAPQYANAPNGVDAPNYAEAPSGASAPSAPSSPNMPYAPNTISEPTKPAYVPLVFAPGYQVTPEDMRITDNSAEDLVRETQAPKAPEPPREFKWAQFQHLDNDFFNNTIMNDSENVWVVTYMSPKCKSCRKFKPHFERLSENE